MDKNTYRIAIEEEDTSSFELDELVTEFKGDLSNLNVQFLNHEKEDHDEIGKKGDPITVGTFLVALSPVALTSIFNFFQIWAVNRRKITLEAPNGAKIEFVPDKKYSKEELVELIEELNKIN